MTISEGAARQAAIQLAGDLMSQRYHCSEAMMLSAGRYVMEDLEPRCIRMSTSFGGGVGGCHEELCGAFSAGLMIISGLYGRVSTDEDDTQAYALAKEWRQVFAERWHTLSCGPIRDWVRGPQGPGGCGLVVSETARLLLDLLGR